MKRVDHPMMIYRGVFTKKQVIERVRVKGCMFGLVLDNNRLTFTLFCVCYRQALFLRRTAAAKKIQTCFRRYIQQKKFLAIRRWVIKIQVQTWQIRLKSSLSGGLYLLPISEIHFWIEFEYFLALFQCAARSMFARRLYAQKLRISKSIIIQKSIRGWLQRRKFQRVMHGIVLLQSHVRRRAAKRELKRLKVTVGMQYKPHICLSEHLQ